MREAVKYYTMFLARVALSLLRVFPVQRNKVMFCTSSGVGFFCNPKYIYVALKDERSKIRFVWCLNDGEMAKSLEAEGCKVCSYHSLAYYYHRMTSSVYVSNAWFGAEVPHRSGQIRIQTWHGGGCYKKTIGQEKRASRYEERRQRLNASETDLMLTSSDYFTETVIRDGFRYCGDVLACGMPRNDYLVQGGSQYESIRERTRMELGLSDEFVVLYAPTWRYDKNSTIEPFDVDVVSNAFERRFGRNVAFLFRAHIHMHRKDGVGMMGVDDYPDMQDLLAATDALVTDYSSSIWDYSFTGKPCFLYVPDLTEYDSERGFCEPIAEWGFPVCEDSEKLATAIAEYDEDEFACSMKRHHETLQSTESGVAARTVANWIETRLHDGE